MYLVKHKCALIPVFVLLGLFLLIVTSGSAQAFNIDSIPEAVNDAVFEGEDLWLAKLLISVSVLVGVGFALAAAKMEVIPVFIVLFGVMGLFIALGWLDYWLALVAGLLVASTFALKMRDVLGG